MIAKLGKRQLTEEAMDRLLYIMWTSTVFISARDTVITQALV
jgi:hypothetical protein